MTGLTENQILVAAVERACAIVTAGKIEAGISLRLSGGGYRTMR